MLSQLIKTSINITAKYFLALLLILFITIIPQYPAISYDYKRLCEFIFLHLTLLISCFTNFSFPYFFNKKIQIYLATLMVLSVASILCSENLKYAAIEFTTLFTLVVGAIQISKVWRKHQRIIDYSITALLAAFFILEITFFTNYLTIIFIGKSFIFNTHILFPSFAHIRFFNQYQIWFLPLLPLILNNSIYKRKSIRFLVKFSSIGCWLMFFSTDGRGAILAMIVSAFLIIYFFRNLAFSYLKQSLLLAVSGFISYQLLFHVIPFIFHHSPEQFLASFEIRTSSSGRNVLWLKALRLIIDHPFLGVGPMHYAYFDPTDLDDFERSSHPHNSILQLASEWGLPILFLILYLLVYAYKQWFSKFNRNTLSRYPLNRRELIIALTYSAFAATLYSMLSGVIVMPMSQLMSVFIISLILANYNIDHAEIKIKKYNYAWFLFPLAIAYLSLVYPEIKELLNRKKNTTMELQEFYPRFWLNGNIYPLEPRTSSSSLKKRSISVIDGYQAASSSRS